MMILNNHISKILACNIMRILLKPFFALQFSLFFFLLIPITQVASSQSAEITVSIKGVKNNKGNICVLLFNNSKGFPDNPDNALLSKIIPAQTREIIVKLDGITPDTYAVTVLHDENKNFKMDYNWLGIPKEGFGVSNNAKGKFGPPKFEDASFKFTGGNHSLSIQMSY